MTGLSIKTAFTAVFPFGGLGGGAEGFKDAVGEWGGAASHFRILYGADADPEACEDFRNITGAPSLLLDFFSRDQYIAFHGTQPPEDWRELTPEDIYALSNGETPDVKFSSAPCKGFTFLLSKEKSDSSKYQALNQLALREMELYLQAFEHDPIPFMIMENVPGIRTRGIGILNAIKKLLIKYGYALREEIFDCGVVGGLGESRRRYILVARYKAKMTAEVYLPEPKRLRTIGEVLEPIPLPSDPSCGPLHEYQNLAFISALRLALIGEGKDWRCLEEMDFSKYRLSYTPRGGGAYGVQAWNKPGNTVIGNAKVTGSNGAAAVADPRLNLKPDAKRNLYRMLKYDETSPTVTGAAGPSNGALCVADHRLMDYFKCFEGVYQIEHQDNVIPISQSLKLPKLNKRGKYIILSQDGSWHRAVTTYEMAMIQGFKSHLPDGRPFQLCGKDKKAQRERIGNAVPPPSAKSWAEVILVALMASSVSTWTMGITDVWVNPNPVQDPLTLVH